MFFFYVKYHNQAFSTLFLFLLTSSFYIGVCFNILSDFDDIFKEFLGVKVNKATSMEKSITITSDKTIKTSVFSECELFEFKSLLGMETQQSCYIPKASRSSNLCQPCDEQSHKDVKDAETITRFRSSDLNMKTRALATSVDQLQSYKCKDTCQEGKRCIGKATHDETKALLKDFWGEVNDILI